MHMHMHMHTRAFFPPDARAARVCCGTSRLEKLVGWALDLDGWLDA